MASTETTARKQLEALERVRTVVETYRPDEAHRLRVLPDGRLPTSVKRPDEFATFLAESVAVLADVFDEREKANAPRPRGRPRKAS